MTMQQKIEQFKAALKKMKAYQHAMGVMFYDFETVMPKGAAEDFAAHMGILSEEVYKMQTAPEFKALIDELYENRASYHEALKAADMAGASARVADVIDRAAQGK